MDDTNEKASDMTLSATAARLLNRLKQRSPEEQAAIDARDAKHAHDEQERQIARVVAGLEYEMGRRYSYARARLDTFEINDPKQQEVCERLKALTPQLIGRIEAGRGLVFLGIVGTGKDHLMAAMLYRAAMAGVTCKWVNGQDVYGQFRDRIDTGEREEDLLRLLTAPKVLAVSDPIPPASDPSPWNLQQLYRLLDRRYRALLPTWVSLNAMSVEDADAKLSAPVFDRIREGAEIFKCFWPSYRERKPQ